MQFISVQAIVGIEKSPLGNHYISDGCGWQPRANVKISKLLSTETKILVDFEASPHEWGGRRSVVQIRNEHH